MALAQLVGLAGQERGLNRIGDIGRQILARLAQGGHDRLGCGKPGLRRPQRGKGALFGKGGKIGQTPQPVVPGPRHQDRPRRAEVGTDPRALLRIRSAKRIAAATARK